MKNLFLLFPLFIFNYCLAQTDAIETLERQRFAAQTKKDMPTLGKIFSDDLVYVHSSGKVDNKISYLKSIETGDSRYDQVDFEDIKVRYYNKKKTAQVNGQILITNKVGGSTTRLHIRYVVLYIKKRQSGWQLVTWQATKII